MKNHSHPFSQHLNLCLAIFFFILPVNSNSLRGEKNNGKEKDTFYLEEAKKILEVSSLKDKKSNGVITKIKKLKSEEAKKMISAIRYVSRSRNPDMDHLYLVLRHLAGIEANALAQKRLQNLLWVIGLSLFLFSSFLVYVFIEQKQAMKLIKEIRQKEKEEVHVKEDDRIYRGE